MRPELQQQGVYVDGHPDKPSVVFLHSIATSSDIWKPLLPLLTQRFRVICIDLPGHAKAPVLHAGATLADYADYLDGVLSELQISPAAMLGISLGGMVAQAYAIAHPDRLRGLILANCAAVTADPIRKTWQARVDAVSTGGMNSQVEDTLARWFTPAFAERSPMCLEWIAGLIERTSVSGYAAAAHAIQHLDHLAALSNVTVPVLLLAGEEDLAVPGAAIERMRSALPNADLVALEGVAHLSAVEAPTVFVEAVGAFLERVLG